MIYVQIFSSGDVFITPSPDRECQIVARTDSPLSVQHTIPKKELLSFSETIDEIIDRYYDSNDDVDTWVNFT